MTKQDKTMSESQIDAVATTLKGLAQTDPPAETMTKTAIIRDHEDDIRAALERGWTQNQIASALANEAGVTVTTETLRNALSFRPSDVKRPARTPVRKKAKKATRAKKRHEAKTKANTAATPEETERNDHQNGGAADVEPKPTNPEVAEEESAERESACTKPQPGPDHAALQEDI